MLLFICKSYKNVSLSCESVMAVLYVGMWELSITHFAFGNYRHFDLTPIQNDFIDLRLSLQNLTNAFCDGDSRFHLSAAELILEKLMKLRRKDANVKKHQ